MFYFSFNISPENLESTGLVNSNYNLKFFRFSELNIIGIILLFIYHICKLIFLSLDWEIVL